MDRHERFEFRASRRGRQGISSTIMVLAIVVAVMAIAAVALLALGMSTAQSVSPKSGDYVKFDMSGTANGVSITGSMQMTYGAVTSSGYTLETTMTVNGQTTTSSQSYGMSGNQLVPIDQPSSSSSSSDNGVLIGTEKITTVYGVQDVKHYRSSNSSGSFDTYLSTGSGMLLKAILGYGSAGSLTLTISDTDINWQTSPAAAGALILASIGLFVVVAILGATMFVLHGRSKRQAYQPIPTAAPIQPMAAPLTIYCPQCSKPAGPGEAFCSNCGTRLR